MLRRRSGGGEHLSGRGEHQSGGGEHLNKEIMSLLSFHRGDANTPAPTSSSGG